MAYVSDLIRTGIRWALFLLAIGRLPAATYWLAQQVTWEQAHPFSLVRLNHALLTGGKSIRRSQAQSARHATLSRTLNREP
jgi:hypothetical protein